MFRDLYSTKARVHNFRSEIQSERTLATLHLPQTRRETVSKLSAEAMQTLGMFPPERQLLYHHPLNGLEELAFIDALDLLHRLTGASVWPSVSQMRKLFKSGAISEADWERACRENSFGLDRAFAIQPQELLSHFFNATEALSPVRSLPSPSLAASLDQVLQSNLLSSLTSELTLLLTRYSEVEVGTEAGQSLWLFAARSDDSHLFAADIWELGPEAALLKFFDMMAIPQSLWKEWMLQAAWVMPGWSAWLKRAEGADFLSMLALRAGSEFHKIQVLGRRYDFAPRWSSVQTWIHAHRAGSRVNLARSPYTAANKASLFALQALALEARESAWRQQFLKRLKLDAPRQLIELKLQERPNLQGIFCIDPRCEPIRCAWERQGSIETFSMSGAFTLRPQHLAPEAYPDTAQLIERLLLLCGDPQKLARLVLVCGHSHPHKDSWCSGFLECTACGGWSGERHAQHAAEVLNDPIWRHHLAKLGIEIPADTVFIGGVYRTDSQEVSLVACENIPASHASDLQALTATLKAAQASLRPLIEQWMGGAAGHGAFLIGPRALSRELELDSTCFLHSYDSFSDETGEQLGQIFQGALRVALSINLQYYFAAVDPERWSAGSVHELKAIGPCERLRPDDHDLARGLPREALRRASNGQMHEALRLQVFVVASLDQVRSALTRNESIARALRNRWFTLVVLDPISGEVLLPGEKIW